MIRVIKPGLATSVQDLGRPGYYHLGIPQSGAMDHYAIEAANLLVGNDKGAAALEATFMGPELEFTRDAVVAVTGAAMTPRVNGDARENWCSFDVRSGDVLSFDFLKGGARSYIAVSGGIDTPPALGSRSTYVLGALGGFHGRPLAEGDEIPLGAGTGGVNRELSAALRPALSASVELRVLPGIFWHWMEEVSQNQFFADTWKVAPEADRIGYRFRGGEPIKFNARERPFGAGSDPSNIVDGCYPYGSIQVPGGTEPIVLHRDAVSGGGYFMLGTVISADMDLIGQMQPHTQTRFVKVTMDEALEARHARNTRFDHMRNALA